MIASKQLWRNKIGAPPSDIRGSTSQMMQDLGLYHCLDTSSCAFLLGQQLLKRIHTVIDNVAESYGLSEIEIPILTRDELLAAGAPIESGFSKQIMRLAPPVTGYHLLFTPEPVIQQLACIDLLSYRQLPVRLCYYSKMFRELTDVKGILKSREFNIFMGAAIDTEQDISESLILFKQLTCEVLRRLRIPFRVVERLSGINVEFYYIGSKARSWMSRSLMPKTRYVLLA